MSAGIDELLWQVDSATGEVVPREPSVGECLRRVAELAQERDDLERDMRRFRARERLLLAQLEDDRQGYERREEVQTIFDEWREKCRHKNARLTNDRFDAIRRLLEVKKPQPYQREHFSLAIAGAAFDPFVKQRKNGSWQRFDDIALVCRDGKTFESFVARAPKKENHRDKEVTAAQH